MSDKKNELLAILDSLYSDYKSDTFYVIPNTDESTVRESIENKLKEMNTNIDIDIYVFIFPIDQNVMIKL
jgi:uncharacterized protein YeeX (DUF496 family)